MLTNKDKLERLAQADYIDPTGKLRAMLEELYKHPEKDWNKPKVHEKVKEAINSTVEKA